MRREHVWDERRSRSLGLGKALLDGHSRCLGRQIMKLGDGTTRLGGKSVVSRDVWDNEQDEEEGWPGRMDFGGRAWDG